MLSNRQAISQLRDLIKERSADSTYTNQFLYQILSKHAKWLIRRETRAGRIYRSVSLFQTLKCFEVMEASTIEGCDIDIKCKIYRTVAKLPSAWEDANGLMIKEVKSIDGSHVFAQISPSQWVNLNTSPYSKYSKSNYYFYSNGYLYFPKKAPKLINIVAYFIDDISQYCSCCEENKKCTRFLDQVFRIPEWIEAEVFAKALEELVGITKRMIEDEQIDSNTTRKS